MPKPEKSIKVKPVKADKDSGLALGGVGDDRLMGRNSDDILFGDTGDDRIAGGKGNDTLFGGEGLDFLIGGADADQFVFSSVDSGASFTYEGVTVSNADVLADLSFGEGDTIDLRGFSNLLSAAGVSGEIDSILKLAAIAGAADSFQALEDNSVIITMTDDAGATHLLRLMEHADQQFATTIGELLVEAAAAVVPVEIIPEESNNLIAGTPEADVLVGTAEADTIMGREGNDRLHGHRGNDNLQGEAGNDYLNGEAGDDFLSGGEGNDELYGSDGNDTLQGGQGRDYLTGGVGADQFIFSSDDAGATFDYSGFSIENVDVITDLSFGEGDVLVLQGFDNLISAAGIDGMIDTMLELSALAGAADSILDLQSNSVVITMTDDNGASHLLRLMNYSTDDFDFV